MAGDISDKIIGFYQSLFRNLFFTPLSAEIADRRRRDAVDREIQGAADAASQSLEFLFESLAVSAEQVYEILAALEPLNRLLGLEDIATQQRLPEQIARELLTKLAGQGPIANVDEDSERALLFRLALGMLVQVLALLGPLIAQWRKFQFSSTFELLRQATDRLNEIRESHKALAQKVNQNTKTFVAAGVAASDKRFEQVYRDSLLQRFYRVEVGTVRLTTNLGVDLQELFVMPRVRVRKRATTGDDCQTIASMLDLESARRLLRGILPGAEKASGTSPAPQRRSRSVAALHQARKSKRLVIIGAPGSGKSTFSEWLQLQVAGNKGDPVLGPECSIPILLRVRQLDFDRLPTGSALVEVSTNNAELVKLMPESWVERQMEAGRILFILDGLDETDAQRRDKKIIPWFAALVRKYKKCRFLVSSRPAGYPAGFLNRFHFVEAELDDFEDGQIAEYARHWCIARRLAENEPQAQAKRAGFAEGDKIVASFEDNPYVRNLARNPLMLSAVCLVRYFEGGQLPKDRALLYRLCVEGLLHHWDQRRGINSVFTFEEKFRVSRELAIRMQVADRAEFEAARVQKVFAETLGKPERAAELLEHIRYRTGLLVERRAGVFAFAHLTFQEYLAACAVNEGNGVGITPEQLAREYSDPRWREVIALYCGVAPANSGRQMIGYLIAQQPARGQPEEALFSGVLAEALLSAKAEVSEDEQLRRRVIRRIAAAEGLSGTVELEPLSRFGEDEVTPIALDYVGTATTGNLTTAYYYMVTVDIALPESEGLIARLKNAAALSPFGQSELMHVVHLKGSAEILAQVAMEAALYALPGPHFTASLNYRTQAEIGLIGLGMRPPEFLLKPGPWAALNLCLRLITQHGDMSKMTSGSLLHIINDITPNLVRRHVADHDIFVQILQELSQIQLPESPAFHPADASRPLMTVGDWLSGYYAGRTKVPADSGHGVKNETGGTTPLEQNKR